MNHSPQTIEEAREAGLTFSDLKCLKCSNFLVDFYPDIEPKKKSFYCYACNTGYIFDDENGKDLVVGSIRYSPEFYEERRKDREAKEQIIDELGAWGERNKKDNLRRAALKEAYKAAHCSVPKTDGEIMLLKKRMAGVVKEFGNTIQETIKKYPNLLYYPEKELKETREFIKLALMMHAQICREKGDKEGENVYECGLVQLGTFVSNEEFKKHQREFTRIMKRPESDLSKTDSRAPSLNHPQLYIGSAAVVFFGNWYLQFASFKPVRGTSTAEEAALMGRFWTSLALVGLVLGLSLLWDLKRLSVPFWKSVSFWASSVVVIAILGGVLTEVGK